MSAEAALSQLVADRQRAMFAMFVGPGLFATRAALVSASGIPDSTLREWAKGAAMPLHGFLRLAQVLPGEAINMLCEPAGKRLCDIEAVDTNWVSLAARTASVTSQICGAQADGRIDHVEEAALKKSVRALIADAASVVADG